MVIFDPKKLEEDIKELENETLESGFWENQEKSKKITKEINSKKSKLNGYEKLNTDYEDVIALLEFVEAGEKEFEEELEEKYENIKKEFEEFETMLLLGGKYDLSSAIVTIHSGAGGTESCDWAEMLFRMYSRWCAENGYDIEIIDKLDGDEAGIKSITFIAKGEYAYGYLKSEKGVHRLVRISPFDSNKRRHTSFASLDVVPEIEDDLEVEINPQDLKIDTFRSSGAGGQHVNVTDSAVRITHLPTKIVVNCQNERSQMQNKETAMKVLRAKLFELEMRKKEEEMRKIQGEMSEIGWGNQIRSYVFQPYMMVKDHRTNYEIGNVNSVMDGDINGFINAYLHWKR